MSDPTNKLPRSLGQLGYEAYATHTNWKSLATGQPLPQWQELPPDSKAAWETIGEAYNDFFYFQQTRIIDFIAEMRSEIQSIRNLLKDVIS